jgi:cell division protein FtsI/penicillin-binding protein 2
LDAINKRTLATSAVILLCLGQRSVFSCVAQDLRSQAAAATLARQFSSPDLSFLLLDDNGNVIAQRWDHPEREVPVGSLIKPFLAVAYRRTHASFPRFHCAGKATCWLPRGHGTLGIRQAIALSCNSYFHQLVADAEPGFAAPILEHFGLTAGTSEVDMVQQGGVASPLVLAKAYLELANHSRDEAEVPVLQGMALSAQKGTAKAAGAELPHLPALAKTGTAPCIHPRKAPGDGFALVMAPADHPRSVLLVRLHGRPGSMAAAVAGRMIAAVESSDQRK